MLPTQIRVLLVAIFMLIISIFFGISLATNDYNKFIISITVCALIWFTVQPGYAPAVAISALLPLSFSLAFVWAIPVSGVLLVASLMKSFFSESIKFKRPDYPKCFTWAVVAFFGWVVVRYCISPVKPGVSVGAGEGVTGFRTYLNYAIAGGFALGLGRFVSGFDDAKRLVRWFWIISMVCSILFIPLVFTKSETIISGLQQFGITTGTFDNGWLRILVLPGFGLLLTLLTFLPNLLVMGAFARMTSFFIGVAGVILGGNRISLVMLMLAIIVIAVVQQRWKFLLGSATVISMVLGLFYYIGESANFDRGVGLYRVVTLVSGRAAEMSEAGDTIRWRMLRWERATVDIKAHPWIGVGYGGLDRAFIFGNRADLNDALIEIDVAAGSVHNGYISGARAFGIPCFLLFVYILLSQIFSNFAAAVRATRSRDLSRAELHAFLAAYLCSLGCAIFAGSDLHISIFWIIVGAGIIVKNEESYAKRNVRPQVDALVADTPAIQSA